MKWWFRSLTCGSFIWTSFALKLTSVLLMLLTTLSAFLLINLFYENRESKLSSPFEDNDYKTLRRRGIVSITLDDITGNRKCQNFQCAQLHIAAWDFSNSTSGEQTKRQFVDFKSIDSISQRRYSGLQSEVSVLSDESGLSNVSVETPILVYNAVPKCGSTTMINLIRSLSPDNSFVFRTLTYQQLYGKKDHKDTEEGFDQGSELYFLQHHYKSSSINKGYVTAQHAVFIDAERYGLPSQLRPNWMNIIREPVKRLSSLYYHGTRPALKDESMGAFDKCVKARNEKCYYLEGKQRRFLYTFFCGSAKECFQFGNRDGLLRAMWNVENIYSVVGITDDMEKTVQILETFLPRFFRGATKIFKADQKLNTNRYKHPNNETLAILYSNKAVSMDIEFYNFVKQRLHKQHQQLMAGITKQE